ncbi:MAG: type II CAAX endopeptidase family protein [Cytophagales bacterium]|nr:type II CAAX endopeptidase family protein [Cytophagales bacterium]
MTLKFKSSISALFVPLAYMTVLVTLSAFPLGFSIFEGRVAYSFLGVAIAFGIILIVIKREKATFRNYELYLDKGTYGRFIQGFLWSILLGGGMILIHMYYSGLQFTVNSDHWQMFILMSLTLIPYAFIEELIFRSVLLTRLNKTYNIWVAQIVIAILFALYHVVGVQGQSLASAFMGPGIWSFIFVALALKSNGISMPTGFHYGLNLVLATIGDKSWIPGLLTVDFIAPPTTSELQAHETFGLILHLLLLVIGIAATVYLQKQMSSNKNQPS